MTHSVSFDDSYTGRLSAGVERVRKRYNSRLIVSRVRLPDWQAFATRRKDLDPVRAFLAFVVHELGGILDGHLIDPSRLFLVEDDDSRLTVLERSWYRWRTGRPKDAWVDLLQLSPLVFSLGSSLVTPKWAEPGFVYIAAGAIRRPTGDDRWRLGKDEAPAK